MNVSRLGDVRNQSHLLAVQTLWKGRPSVTAQTSELLVWVGRRTASSRRRLPSLAVLTFGFRIRWAGTNNAALRKTHAILIESCAKLVPGQSYARFRFTKIREPLNAACSRSIPRDFAPKMRESLFQVNPTRFRPQYARTLECC